MFTLIIHMLKSICNRIMCVCHLAIKDYLLIYLLPYLLTQFEGPVIVTDVVTVCSVTSVVRPSVRLVCHTRAPCRRL